MGNRTGGDDEAAGAECVFLTVEVDEDLPIDDVQRCIRRMGVQWCAPALSMTSENSRNAPAVSSAVASQLCTPRPKNHR